MDYRISGEGLLQFGLSADGVIDGVGLLTSGFVWGCYSPFVPGISNTVSTSWATVFGTSSTTWSGVTGIIFGPC